MIRNRFRLSSGSSTCPSTSGGSGSGFLGLFRFFVLGASAVVEVAEVLAVEERFLETFVYFVVDVAAPAGGGLAGGGLWGEFGEERLEVGGAFTAVVVLLVTLVS